MAESTTRMTNAIAGGEIDSRKAVYVTCGTIVALFGIYFPILRNMVHHWSVVEDYQHGYRRALALYFAYQKRWDLEDAKIDGSAVSSRS